MQNLLVYGMGCFAPTIQRTRVEYVFFPNVLYIFRWAYKRVPEALDGGVKDVGAPDIGDVRGRGPETPA